MRDVAERLDVEIESSTPGKPEFDQLAA